MIAILRLLDAKLVGRAEMKDVDAVYRDGKRVPTTSIDASYVVGAKLASRQA